MYRININKTNKLTACVAFVIGVLCIISLSLMPYLNGPVFAKSDEKEKPELNVFNPADTPIGSVDDQGSVYNRLGRLIGSVDGKGIIYNISKNPIGKVEANGKVFNRVGKLVGSVDDEGNVFNNNGRKIGSVKSPIPGNIILIGGAAWLLLLGVR
ncbi:MAG: hypothetical protein PVI53_09715 [Desulfobacteraceae bacterium]|jgi:hypothetical protein